MSKPRQEALALHKEWAHNWLIFYGKAVSIASLKRLPHKGACLAQSVEHSMLDLDLIVVSSSPMLGVEIT